MKLANIFYQITFVFCGWFPILCRSFLVSCSLTYLFLLLSRLLLMGACSVAESCPILCDPFVLLPARFLCPWDFSGMILMWVSISFSRGSSQPRIHVFCISCNVGGYFPIEPWGKSLCFQCQIQKIISKICVKELIIHFSSRSFMVPVLCSGI